MQIFRGRMGETILESLPLLRRWGMVLERQALLVLPMRPPPFFHLRLARDNHHATSPNKSIIPANRMSRKLHLLFFYEFFSRLISSPGCVKKTPVREKGAIIDPNPFRKSTFSSVLRRHPPLR
jgi:hypothetical protein